MSNSITKGTLELHREMVLELESKDFKAVNEQVNYTLFLAMQHLGRLAKEIKKRGYTQKNPDLHVLHETGNSLIKCGLGLSEYAEKGDPVAVFDFKDQRFIHTFLGMVDELGEIAEEIARVGCSGDEIDDENMLEEAGDLFYFFRLFLESQGLDLEEVASGNIAKLRKRYGDKFSVKKFEERDGQGEMQAIRRNLRSRQR